jgi:Arc/MetJ-type ribon-helix-helix transcriptional regulator
MSAKKDKRVVFMFDDRSLATLQEMTKDGPYASMADTVRDSLQISRALQTQAQKGFTEIVVRDPETEEERVLVIPSLQSLPRKDK